MWNAGLDESQAEVKIAKRNINNLRYADDTILMEKKKREKELNSLLMRPKEKNENDGLYTVFHAIKNCISKIKRTPLTLT